MMNGTARPQASARGSGTTNRVCVVASHGTVSEEGGAENVLPGDGPLPLSPALSPCGDPVNTAAGSGSTTLPVDIGTMRATARCALTETLSEDDLDTLTLTLRGHMQLLVPEVEAIAEREPKDSAPRYCARACVAEARRKLRIGDGCTPAVRVAVAQRLARSVNALCDHYENLRAAQR